MRLTKSSSNNRFNTVNKSTVAGNYNSIEQSQAITLQAVKSVAAAGRQKMSDRQSEWYLTDKRLIFACSEYQDFALWVCKLEELVRMQTSSPFPQHQHQSYDPLSMEYRIKPFQEGALTVYDQEEHQHSFSSPY